MDTEHVDQQLASRSRSRLRPSCRSFVCPDCGLGVESIAALTVHLLTHADLPSHGPPTSHGPASAQQTGSDRESEAAAADTQHHDTSSHRTATTSSNHQHHDGDDGDDDDTRDVDDHDQSYHHYHHHHQQQQATHDSASEDVESARVGEVDDAEPKCLKVECRQSSGSQDTLDGVVLLECPYCQRQDFDSVAPLTSHIRTAHARPSDNLFTCTVCGLAFATVGKLEHHQRVEHDSTASTPAISAAGSLSGSQGSPTSAVDGLTLTEPRWLCRFCPVHFYDAQTQREHEESIHLSRNPASVSSAVLTETSVVFCSQCSLGFPHIYALADHMHHSHGYNARARAAASDVAPAASPADREPRGRDPVRPTALRADSRPVSTNATALCKCSECSATFDSDDQLESHVASAHYLNLGTEFGCTSCLKLFARPEDLQKHLMDVHAHHLYRCTLCKQVFDSKVRAHYTNRLHIVTQKGAFIFLPATSPNTDRFNTPLSSIFKNKSIKHPMMPSTCHDTTL